MRIGLGALGGQPLRVGGGLAGVGEQVAEQGGRSRVCGDLVPQLRAGAGEALAQALHHGGGEGGFVIGQGLDGAEGGGEVVLIATSARLPRELRDHVASVIGSPEGLVRDQFGQHLARAISERGEDREPHPLVARISLQELREGGGAVVCLDPAKRKRELIPDARVGVVRHAEQLGAELGGRSRHPFREADGIFPHGGLIVRERAEHIVG